MYPTRRVSRLVPYAQHVLSLALFTPNARCGQRGIATPPRCGDTHRGAVAGRATARPGHQGRVAATGLVEAGGGGVQQTLSAGARIQIDVYFCDPTLTLATRQQRKHQRAPTPILPQKALTSRAIPKPNSRPSPTNSTTAHERHSAGANRPKSSTNSWSRLVVHSALDTKLRAVAATIARPSGREPGSLPRPTGSWPLQDAVRRPPVVSVVGTDISSRRHGGGSRCPRRAGVSPRAGLAPADRRRDCWPRSG
jgi:hypothetical protein